MDEIRHLEEKIAHLERHVSEQDRAMLDFAEELAQLRRAVKVLQGRLPEAAAGEPGLPEEDERPPHY